MCTCPNNTRWAVVKLSEFLIPHIYCRINNIFLSYTILRTLNVYGNQSANGNGPRKLATEYFYETKTYLDRIDSFRSVSHQCVAHKHITSYILTRRYTVVHSVLYQRQSSFTKLYSTRAFVTLLVYLVSIFKQIKYDIYNKRPWGAQIIII